MPAPAGPCLLVVLVSRLLPTPPLVIPPLAAHATEFAPIGCYEEALTLRDAADPDIAEADASEQQVQATLANRFVRPLPARLIGDNANESDRDIRPCLRPSQSPRRESSGVARRSRPVNLRQR